MAVHRHQALALSVFLAAAGIAAAAETTTYFYPGQKNADFSVTAPDGWTATAGEEVGDYFELESPSGISLSFRTVEGTDAGMEGAVKDSLEYFNETYSNVKLGEATDHKVGDAEGFYAVGSGKDKEDGTAYVFGVAWYALSSGNIAEIYFAVEAGDDAALEEAKKVLDTFSPK